MFTLTVLKIVAILALTVYCIKGAFCILNSTGLFFGYVRSALKKSDGYQGSKKDLKESFGRLRDKFNKRDNEEGFETP
jgi:hypothetical protein